MKPDREADIFATTRWTVVRAAGGPRTPQADAAMEQLCRAYWFPLYAYVRRCGHTKEDAEDLTQAFFARFLTGNSLGDAAAERGKFRAFLLASLKHFLANARDKAQALKRGGGVEHLSLDWASAEAQFPLIAGPAGNPEKAFDREWAVALLDTVLRQMAREWASEGRAGLFERLKGFLTVDGGARSYPESAAKLGMSEGAVRVAVHRLRKRYRQVLRDEVARTLADPAQVAEEMQTLFDSFRD